MALGFGAAILLGAWLLTLPAACTGGNRLSFINALFTSTSATCVTGLSVIDVGTVLTPFGQAVLLTLIQLGGLGITTFGTFLLVLVGRRLSVQNENVLGSSYGIDDVSDLRSLLKRTILFTIVIEGAGALLLWLRYLQMPPGGEAPGDPMTALYYAAFHSISAFCNAGFSLHKDNLVPFQRDAFYLGVIDALIVLGGLGFLVLYNLTSIRFWRRNLKTRGRLSLHSKITLRATVLFILLGAAAFLAQEWTSTLKDLPLRDKLSISLFHSVTPRTAGFNVVPMDQIHESTRLTTSLLMLIGGSPGSAAGGIKTTTLIVLVMTVVAICRNRSETVIYARTVPDTVVREALVISLLAAGIVLAAFGALLWTESPLKPDDASQLLFETISATGTVGLSINRTPLLSTAGKLVIIACMFIGRLGPLAMALLIGSRGEKQRIRYPEEEVVVG